jgi:hypothetical protein
MTPSSTSLTSHRLAQFDGLGRGIATTLTPFVVRLERPLFRSLSATATVATQADVYIDVLPSGLRFHSGSLLVCYLL